MTTPKGSSGTAPTQAALDAALTTDFSPEQVTSCAVFWVIATFILPCTHTQLPTLQLIQEELQMEMHASTSAEST